MGWAGGVPCCCLSHPAALPAAHAWRIVAQARNAASRRAAADDEEDQPGGGGAGGGGGPGGQGQMLYIPGLGYIPLANFPGLGGAAGRGPAAPQQQPEGEREWTALQVGAWLDGRPACGLVAHPGGEQRELMPAVWLCARAPGCRRCRRPRRRAC